MKKHGLYIAAVVMISGLMMWEAPATTWADQEEAVVEEVAAKEAGTDENTNGETESVSRVILANSGEHSEAVENTADDGQAEESAAAQTDADVRQNLVNFALQFVGRPYRAGGNDPHTGADCSGFVKYVMQHGAGISMNRSSRAQATQGRQISADQMQPGDLIFYGNGSRVNHVAMYIGNGQIVHASTERTGIKTSIWNYRTPVRIVSML